MYWTILANFRPFWTQNWIIYNFEHTIKFPRKFYRILMCHTLVTQNGHLGPFCTFLAQHFGIIPIKTCVWKKMSFIYRYRSGTCKKNYRNPLENVRCSRASWRCKIPNICVLLKRWHTSIVMCHTLCSQNGHLGPFCPFLA